MSSWSNPERQTRRRLALLLALVCVASLGSYLAAAASYYGPGFPLDDSWIHQTYARSLALEGQWAFQPGQPSGGSTAPLWTVLLVPGFWLRLAPLPWATLLGILLLWTLSMLGETALRRWVPSYRPAFPWAGCVLALEWHMVWAAGSGMETLLQAVLTTLVLAAVIGGSRKSFGLGLLIGLSVWVRPDGITLLGPAAAGFLLREGSGRDRLRGLTGVLLGFAVLFGFYLLFNLVVAGSPWPNTFYAKQAEYELYRQLPFGLRLAQQALQPLVGVGILLAAGAVYAAVTAVKKRSWGLPLALTWAAGTLGLYAWRLPVVYQHGRYAMPVVPVLLLAGLLGWIQFLSSRTWRGARVPAPWRLLTGALLLAFWGRGAWAYAQDVAVIETEMVAVAAWVDEHLPAGTRIAAHDIGALGFFTRRDLVDLAGLISPEVIPFLRDEARLATYLDEQRVEYLVAFPDWYPVLVEGLEAVHVSQGAVAPGLGATNLTVYRWSGAGGGEGP